MNIFRKQFRRGAVSTALFVLLLAVGMAFCSIGAAAWFTTRSQIADMKKRYTTVAVPAGQSDNMGYMFLSFNSLFGVASEEQWTPLTEQEDHQYPGVLAEDVVCRFPGYETIPGDIEIWLSSWLYTEGGRMKSLQVSNVTYTYQSK